MHGRRCNEAPPHIVRSAEQEMFDAATYYDLQVKGLGSAFLDKMETAIAELIEHPTRWPVLKFAVRRRLLHRFPYAILYRDDPDEIVMLAISHLHRRPWYWLDRI